MSPAALRSRFVRVSPRPLWRLASFVVLMVVIGVWALMQSKHWSQRMLPLAAFAFAAYGSYGLYVLWHVQRGHLFRK
jgi:hypothetical protein